MFRARAVGSYHYTSIIEQYTPFGYGTAPQSTILEPFPTVPVATATTIVIVIGVGLLVYFKKYKR